MFQGVKQTQHPNNCNEAKNNGINVQIHVNISYIYPSNFYLLPILDISQNFPGETEENNNTSRRAAATLKTFQPYRYLSYIEDISTISLS